MGEAHYAEKNWAAARDAWRKAITVDPGYLPAYLRIERSYDEHEDTGNRLDEWRECVARYPAAGIPDFMLGKALARVGNDEAATAASRNAFNIIPACQNHLTGLIPLLAKRGEIDPAIECCTKMLAFAPNSTRTLKTAAELLKAKGDVESAIKYSQKAASIEMNQPAENTKPAQNLGLLPGLAQSLAENGDAAAALRNVKNAIEQDPNFPTRNAVAMFWAAADRFEK